MKYFFKSFHKNRIGKRVTSLLVAGVLVMASMPVSEMYEGFVDLSNSIVVHAEPSRASRTFNNVSDFVTYSQEYAANAADRCEDILTLAFSDTEIPSTYVSLGTSAYPFNGTIKLNATAESNYYTLQLDKPLFDYVTDSVAIIKNGTSDAIQLNIQRTSDLAKTANSPLFANYVKHSSEGAKWIIKSEEYDDGNGNHKTLKFSGVIGTLLDNAKIEMVFTSSSKNSGGEASEISASNAVGLICGTMNSGSKITLSLKNGTNDNGTIKSINSHAGGLVGEMKSNSVLELKEYGFQPAVDRVIQSAAGKSAGGLVGKSDGGRVAFSSNFTGNVRVYDKIMGQDEDKTNKGAANAAGGVFGEYKNTTEDEIDLSKFTINCKAEADSVGGVFGITETSDNLIVKSGSLTIKKNNTGGLFGGIAGTYKTNNHLKSFEINTITANTRTEGSTTAYGGAIGKIQDGTTADYAYVKVVGFTHNSTYGCNNTLFGGVVGSSANRGNFLDFGSVTVSTDGTRFTGGGLVGDLSKGVLRLSGTTTMTNAPSANSDNSHRERGQLVGKRVDALVYALGSGSATSLSNNYYDVSTSSNRWRYVRSSVDVYADDIGTWGEVVRSNTIESTSSGYVTCDLTNHTVTIKDAVTTISNTQKLVLLALNIQLNNGSDIGALKFSSSSNSRSSYLLGAKISVSGSSLNFSNTGITGLMRDDYSSTESEIGLFTGSISSSNTSNKTISLAIGERYGVYSEDEPVGRGAICNHRYNGLLAKTGTGAALTNITIGGSCTVNRNADNTYIGGVAAQVSDGVTLTDVDTHVTINFNGLAGAGSYIGGYIGEVTSTNGEGKDITIEKSSNDSVNISPTITVDGTIDSHDNANICHSIGGAIGIIRSTNEFDISFSDVVLSASIEASAISEKDVGIAGLIADIVSATTDSRTLTLTNLSAYGTVINNSASNTSGGILGYRWLNTNVNMENVTLDCNENTSTDNTLTTNASYAGGLVFAATGHWIIPSGGLKIYSFIDERTNPTGFGMIANDGYYSTSGMFLDLTAEDSYYLSEYVTVPKATNYDELVAYTSNSDNKFKNGNDNNVGVGVISITTSDSLLSMDEANCNTYQNVFDERNLNDRSRYYYNISAILSKSELSRSDGEKLLLWSLSHYASKNISDCFPNAYSRTDNPDKITGTNFDMTNLSYYPIDIVSGVELGDISVKFYNNEIESTETKDGNTDGKNRSTRSSASQHYLMHYGLFKNVSSDVTTSGDLHFKGNIGADSSYSGALICGSLTGSLETSSSKEIVLEGITLSNSNFYLLIKGIGDKATLKLRKVRVGGSQNFNDTPTVNSSEETYSTGTVAASLIGDASGSGIQLEFGKIKLDARKAANSSTYSGFDTIYGTSSSIFSKATLLNKFDGDSSSSAFYNFNENEDWNGSTHLGNVTYGQEIITSKEFVDKQQKYYDQTNFVHPFAGTPAAKYDDFKNHFYPYVYSSTASNSGTTREIRVNVKISGLTAGCGTYNHPYEISQNDQFPTVAKAIAGTQFPETIRLPLIQGTNISTFSHWDAGCDVFTLSGDNYTATVSSTTYTWTKVQVRQYLASAYYMVMRDITLDPTFTGLGSVASDVSDDVAATTGAPSTGKYAFRGVIVGANPNVTITNKAKRVDSNTNYANTPGLIAMSNGSVVKDLKIKVDLSMTDTTTYAAKKKYHYMVKNISAYAYDDVFPNYGAVINKIMGGDNIIDNVKVEFNNDFNVLKNDNKDYSATIGGYVGCVVSGGLVFRNVSDTSLTTTKTVNNVTSTTTGFIVNKVNDTGTDAAYTVNGKSISNMNSEDDLAHLYVNPFVGRVINGYAIRESDSYKCSEKGTYSDTGNTRSGVSTVTMHNTQKNYSIPDIDASLNYQSTDNDKKQSVLLFSQKSGSGVYNKISIPNSQALYIMSIIAQSGMGCAGGDTADSEDYRYEYTISFDGKARRNYSGNAGRNASGNTTVNGVTITKNEGVTYKTSRHAKYDNIGSGAVNTTGSDYDISKLDQVNFETTIPYIIYKYTSSYTSNGKTYYPARTLTKRNFYVELSADSATYYLPDCFRGIGFLGSVSNDDCMKIYSFNGNNNTIDLNSLVYHIVRGSDPYFNINMGGNSMNHGIALFNRLVQNKADDNRNYSSDKDHQICDFTLTGSIDSNCRNNNGTAKTNNGSSYDMWRAAGLVAFAASADNNYYNVESVTMTNFHVKSMEYAGGLFGRLDSGRVFINNCNATNLKVEGYCRIGGYIGNNDCEKSYDGVFINTGSSASSSALTNIQVIHLGVSGGDAKWHCAGGVMGQVYSKANKLRTSDADCAHFLARNITMNGGTVESTNYIARTGGILGGIEQNSGVLIIDCSVNNVKISGLLAGGIVGRTTNVANGLRIVDCNVQGTIDEETNKPTQKIYGSQYAGGIIGHNETVQGTNPKYNNVSYSKSVDGCLVKDYEIESETGGSGGVLGELATASFTIANTKTDGCQIHSHNCEDGRGVSAIVGYCAENKQISGYNVVSCNNTLYNDEDPEDTLIGSLVGNANSGLTIKLVGYSRSNNKIKDESSVSYDIGRLDETENIPETCDTANSYIIYSDYNNTCLNASPNKDLSTFNNNDTFVSSGVRGTEQRYFPYAIVNPTTNMGTGSFLTSDAAALNSSSKPLAKDILSDATAHGYFGFADSVKTSVTNALNTTDDSLNKISTYRTETAATPFSFDFPVVVISTQTQSDSSELIDNYIKVMTNSSLDFRKDKSGVYKVNNIYACTYKNNKYSIDTSSTVKAGLKYSSTGSGYFYMEKGYADSNQDNNQISLIDVEFFDPNDSTKVAYHLYVPVLTKKMVSFNFNSASLTGTDFKVSTENSSSPTPYVFGNKLAEALGTWYTSYIMYTYPRSELQDLVDSGKGLSWNHNKVITLNYKNTDGKLNDTTKLVLIDMNNADKAYYSTMGSIRTGTPEGQTTQADQINLKDFRTSTSGGTAFVQKNLHDLVTVTAEAKSSGTYAELAQGDDPSDYVVIKAKLNGVEKTFKYVGENNGGTHKLTVDSDGYERYFLSFLTPSTGTLYDYTIACPKNLSSQAGGLKGLRNDSQSSYTTIVIGNLFKQTVELEKVALKNNESSWIVDSVYNQIQVNVNTTIEISNPSYSSYLTSYLNDPSIHLYQAFVLYLNKHKEDGSDTNVIGGNPGVTTSFTIDDYDSTAENPGPKPFEISTNEGVVNEGSITSYPGGKTYAMLEKHDIKQQFIDSPLNKITISSHSIIDYSDGNDRLEGFPEASSRGTIGVNISAKSNLSYNGTEEKIVYGTMSGNATPPSTINFYREDSGKVSLSYDAKIIDDAFDKDGILSKNKSQLGLNAKNLADVTRTNIPLETVASYNASNVTDFSKAKSIKCTLTLYKKTDNSGNVEYEQVANLSDYFTGSIKLKSTGTSMVSIDQTVTVPSASYVEFTGTNVDITKKAFDADIDFNVKIKDDGFNEYANYKVMLTVQLFQSDGTTPVDGSLAYNHIVYTNAKIDPSIIRAS